MPEKISWTFNIQVVGGPAVSDSKSIDVEAYDKIDVTIADGATDEAIETGGAGQVQFLLIKSDQYGDQLTYKVNSAGAGTTPIKLDASQHVFIGTGAVGLLGAPPTKLFFSNKLGKAATIQILIGRKVTTA